MSVDQTFQVGQKVCWVDPNICEFQAIVVQGPDADGRYTLISCQDGCECYGYSKDGLHKEVITPVE